jgi:hypothetical protein
VRTEPADGLSVRVAEVTTTHQADVFVGVQGGPVESCLSPHPAGLDAQRWRGRNNNAREVTTSV